jgi:DNA-binding CsgD family transcriptional regulator
MNKPDTKLLYNVWENSKEHIAKQNVELQNIKVDELIATVFSSGPFYYYIIDFYDMKIKHMSPQVKAHHGLDPETATLQDILDLIHPDDMDFVAKAEKIAWEMIFKKLGSERSKKYKISYCFRFRTPDGTYQLYNHLSVILSADEDGGLAKSLNIHANISHLTSENNYKISFIGMFGEPSYLNIDVKTDARLLTPSNPLFTKRESEIIRLMAEGLTSDEIASRLFIAVETVKTHRKNILGKSGCKNVGHLLTKCITEGLL